MPLCELLLNGKLPLPLCLRMGLLSGYTGSKENYQRFDDGILCRILRLRIFLSYVSFAYISFTHIEVAVIIEKF